MPIKTLSQLSKPLLKMASHSPVYYQAQARTTRALAKLPDRVLMTLVKRLDPQPRFDSADPLMQLIMAANNMGSGGRLISSNISSSRQRFNGSVSALQGAKPTVYAVRDLSFKNRHQQRIKLRHYVPKLTTTQTPKNVAELPLIVFFHGGGFALGNLETHDEFCHYLCYYSGFSVLSVDYRLSPEHAAPAAIHDCMDAVVWAAENVKKLGYKAGNIIVAGDSAGGNLATVVCQQLLKTNNAVRPIMQWLIYPVTDAKGNYDSHKTYSAGTLLSLRDKDLFESFYISDSKENDHTVTSPIYGTLDGLPPAYVTVAELDILSDEGEAYAQRLAEKGITVAYDKAPGMPHGFINLVSIHRGARLQTIKMIKDMREFYNTTLQSKVH
jgi:acetyl esterase